MACLPDRLEMVSNITLSRLYFTGVPVNADDRNVKYKLVNIFEPGGLWDQRNNTDLYYNAGGGFKALW